MSSISFDADLQTDKLESGIKKSGKAISVWIMESVIKVRKLEDEINALNRAIEKTPIGGGVANLVDQWKQKTAELNKETEQLVELQKKEASEVSKTEGAQKGMISSLIEWGTRLGIVTGAITFFKAVVASSNALTEQFEFTVDGAKGALQQFFQVFSANTNQTGNVITNIIKGFKGAKDLSQAVDAYNDSMKANQVLEAQEINSLKEKEAIFRNASNDATKRKEALDEWIKIKKDAAARELKIEKDLNDALKSEIKNRPNLKGITDTEIGNYVTMYATNPDLMQKAEELSKVFSGAQDWDTGDKVAKLRKEIDALLPAGLSYESLMSSIRLNTALNGKQIDALRESYKRLAGAEAGGAEVEAETARWMGSIVNKGNEADKKLNDIKVQIANLKTALETAGVSERKGIADKIVLLEKELALREKIVRQAIQASELSGFIPAITPTSQLTGPSFGIHSAPEPTVKKTQAEIRKDMYSLRGAPDIKKAVDTQKDLNKSVEQEAEAHRKVFNEAARLTFEIGKQMGLSEQEQELLGSTLDAFSQLAEGNYLGAATSLISGLMQEIPTEAKRFQGQIDEINKSIEKQQLLIAKSERTGGQQDLTKQKLDTLNQERAAIEGQIAKDQKKMNSWIDLFGSKKRAQEDYVNQMAALDDIQSKIDEAQQAFDDLLSGGVTQNNIADVIAQGFQEGKTSVDDFAKYMNDVLVNAVLNVFKGDILGPAINELTDYIAKALSDKVLSPEEKANINKMTNDIAVADKPLWDQLTSSLDMGNNIGQASTMVGTIQRSIDEDTATEWVGLARKQADDLRQIRDFNKEGVDHLVNIEANTWNTVVELKNAVGELKQISSNTKPVYTGSL